MNNATMNREQFNEPINKTPFYLIEEMLFPFKKIPYAVSKSVEYQNPKRVNYSISKSDKYQKPKRISYPTAKNLISHLAKRRKLV